MEKRKDSQVYILCHKPVPYLIDNTLYTPLECGAVYHDSKVCETRDNEGENISELNPILVEDTGIWWLLHNRPQDLKYIGICHYRRQLIFRETFDFDTVLRECTAILPMPCMFAGTVRQQYAMLHHEPDLDIAKEIVYGYYPQYAEDWNSAIEKNNTMVYSNGGMMPTPLFDSCWSFVFDIVEKFYEHIGVKTVKDMIDYANRTYPKEKLEIYKERNYLYQATTGAFLAERLYNVWLRHNLRDNIMFKPYRTYEGAK